MTDWDVIVVGGGPGGSMCARELATMGVRVLLLEREADFGYPIFCAEGVPKEVMDEIFGEMPPTWVNMVVEGAKFIDPDGRSVEVYYSGAGCILERRIFDRDLAILSAKAGAIVRSGCVVYDVQRRKEGVVVDWEERDKGSFSATCKVVVGADGVESLVGRKMGLDVTLKPEELHITAQYLIHHPALKDWQRVVSFAVGREVAPGGYIWVFPKGEDVANVGVGVHPLLAKHPPLWYLDRFVEEHFPFASIIGRHCAGVPTTVGREIVGDRVLLVGDAGRMANPISGGGIESAIVSGMIAGKAIVDALNKGKFSKRSLGRYKKEWERKLGKRMKFYLLAKYAFMELSDDDFRQLMDFVVETFGGKTLTVFDPYKIVAMVAKSSPRFLKLASKILRRQW